MIISPTVASPSVPSSRLLPLIMLMPGNSVPVGSSPSGSPGVPVSFGSFGLDESESSITTISSGVIPDATA